MIPKPVKRLLVEIAEKSGGQRKKIEAVKDPEKCLASLLLNINERITSTSAMLRNTVKYSLFESNLQEAEQFLRRHKSPKVQGKHRSKKSLAAAW